MTFNECLEKFDPEGKLSRSNIEYIKQYYHEGYKHGKANVETTESKCKPVIEQVISVLNEVTGKKFKSSAGHSKIITARINEGYKLEDFERVIWAAWNKWESWDKRRDMMTTQVLFGSAEKMDKRLSWYDDLQAPKEEVMTDKVIKKQDIAF